MQMHLEPVTVIVYLGTVVTVMGVIVLVVAVHVVY